MEERLAETAPQPVGGLAWLATWRRWLDSPVAGPAALAVAGILLELILLGGWVHAFSLAGHPGFPAPGQDPLVWLLGDGPAGIDRFLAMLVVTFAGYLVALAAARRAAGAAAVAVALGGALVLGLTMLAVFPAGALDIFHNIMDGRLLWVYHLSPLLYPPAAVRHDPLFPYLHFWQETTAAYGPLWFYVTLPAVLAGGTSVTRNIVAFKALPFAFEFLALACIVLIMRRIAPRRTAFAVVVFGWNPLVLWEIAGNGHNDIVMLALALLALLALLTRRWPLAFPILACSVMAKYVTALLFPLFVIWILRRHGWRALLPLINGLIAAAVVAAVLFLPLWGGLASFQQLRDQPRDFLFSPASAVIGTWGQDLPDVAVVRLVKEGFTVAFLVLYALTLPRVRRDPAALLRACTETFFFFLFLMAWWFWPWYVLWGLTFAALLPNEAHARLFALFSASAMLIYVASPWRYVIWNMDSGFAMAAGTALLVFTAPALYALLHLWSSPAPQRPAAQSQRRERRAATRR